MTFHVFHFAPLTPARPILQENNQLLLLPRFVLLFKCYFKCSIFTGIERYNTWAASECVEMWIKLLMRSWSLSRNDNQRDDHTIGESAECQLLQSTSEHQRTQRWRCTRIVLSVGVWHICTQNLLWLFLSPKHSHRQVALSTWYQLNLFQHHFFSTLRDKNTALNLNSIAITAIGWFSLHSSPFKL